MAGESEEYAGTSGAELMRLSWQNLKEDRELLAIPILSAIAVNVTCLGIVGILWSTGALIPLASPAPDGSVPSTAYLLGFLIAYVSTFIAVFFQVALCAGAMTRMQGGDPTLKSCFAIAIQRLPQIAMWSLIAATVGMILRAISERVGLLGRLVVAGLSLAWAVATLFVIPIIVVENDGSLAAVSRSTSLVKKRWRNIGTAGLRFGFSFLFVPIAICLAIIITGVGVTWRYDAPLFLIFAAMGFVGLVGVAVVASATGMYLRAVLYRYAAGLPVPGIPQGVLAHALPGGPEPGDDSTGPPRPMPTG